MNNDILTNALHSIGNLWLMMIGAYVLLFVAFALSLIHQRHTNKAYIRQEELNGVFMRQLIELTGFRDDCWKGRSPTEAGKEQK